MGLGDRIADAATSFSGSFTFLGLHIVWWALWIFVLHIEPFPYGLLTMILSLEAIVLSTLVLMSQNRAAVRDRLIMQREAEEVSEIDAIDREEIEILRAMGQHMTTHAEELKLLRALLERSTDGQKDTR